MTQWLKRTGHAAGLVVLGALGTSVLRGAVDTTIHACVAANGAMRFSADGSCKVNESPLSWNVQGIQGIQGIQGPPGDPGNAGTQLLAYVLDPFAKSIDSAIPPPLQPIGEAAPFDLSESSMIDVDLNSDTRLDSEYPFPGSSAVDFYLTLDGAAPKGVTHCVFTGNAASDSVPQHTGFSCGGSVPFLNVAAGHHSIQAWFSGTGRLSVVRVLVKVQRIDLNSVFVSLFPPIS